MPLSGLVLGVCGSKGGVDLHRMAGVSAEPPRVWPRLHRCRFMVLNKHLHTGSQDPSQQLIKTFRWNLCEVADPPTLSQQPDAYLRTPQIHTRRHTHMQSYCSLQDKCGRIWLCQACKESSFFHDQITKSAFKIHRGKITGRPTRLSYWMLQCTRTAQLVRPVTQTCSIIIMHWDHTEPPSKLLTE